DGVVGGAGDFLASAAAGGETRALEGRELFDQGRGHRAGQGSGDGRKGVARRPWEGDGSVRGSAHGGRHRGRGRGEDYSSVLRDFGASARTASATGLVPVVAAAAEVPCLPTR